MTPLPHFESTCYHPQKAAQQKRRRIRKIFPSNVRCRPVDRHSNYLFPMLVHLGERSAAGRIEAALEKVYRGGKHLTRDVGGSASTAEFTGAVVAAIELRHVQSDGELSSGV